MMYGVMDLRTGSTGSWRSGGAGFGLISVQFSHFVNQIKEAAFTTRKGAEPDTGDARNPEKS